MEKHELTEDVKGKLVYFEGELLREKNKTVESATEIGTILLGAQALLANHHAGVFVVWLQSQGFSKSTAYNYMRLPQLGDSCPTVGKLELGAALRLTAIANSKPVFSRVVKDTKKLAERGEPVSQKTVNELIKKHTTIEPEPSHKQPGIPSELAPILAHEKDFAEWCSCLNGLLKQIAQVAEQEAGRYLSIVSIRADIKNVIGAIKDATPTRVCKCGGRGCDLCEKKGWLPKQKADGVV